MTNREYVESVWPNVKECDGPFICTVYSCLDSCDLERGIQGLGNGATLDAAYTAAAAFTCAHMEKIRQVKEEIEWLDVQSVLSCKRRLFDVQKRIYLRERELLDTLCIGIKPEALL
jgi:hypothetical protein